MPYQRKDQCSITISPVVDRRLYNAVVSRGYNVREVVNAAFRTLLDIDDEDQIRYEHLREAMEHLKSHEYKKMKEDMQHQQEEESREHAREAAEKESKNLLLDIIINRCKPSSEQGKNDLASINAAIEDGRYDSEKMLKLQARIRKEAEAAGQHYDDAEILSGIKEAVKRDWKVEN